MSMTPDSPPSLGISLSQCPSMTAPVKDFAEQFSEVPCQLVSGCTKMLQGLTCPLHPNRQHSSTYTIIGFFLLYYTDSASHVPKMTTAAIYLHPPAALSLQEPGCFEHRSIKLLSWVLAGGLTSGRWRQFEKKEVKLRKQIMSDVICTPPLHSLTSHSEGIPFYL